MMPSDMLVKESIIDKIRKHINENKNAITIPFKINPILKFLCLLALFEKESFFLN